MTNFTQMTVAPNNFDALLLHMRMKQIYLHRRDCLSQRAEDQLHLVDMTWQRQM